MQLPSWVRPSAAQVGMLTVLVRNFPYAKMGETAMYIIIETEDGLTIQHQPEGMTAHQVAAECGGILADEGPYHSYEDASDALLILEQEYFEESEAVGRF
jgi:hypothetical protein